MKTSSKSALVFVATSVSAVMALSASADDTLPNSNNCQNIRTISVTHCVHYDEKKRDAWATQEANRLTTKYRTGVGSKNGVGYINPFGAGRDSPTHDQLDQAGEYIYYTRSDGSIGVVNVVLANPARYFASRDALHSIAVQGGAYGKAGGTRSAR